jgi:hypothetical protein
METISKTKRSVAFVLILALALSGVFWRSAPVCGAVNFVDTVGHWADEEIRAAVDYGYINGYTDGRFQPDAAVKRSEFVKIVNSAMRYTALGNIAFQDVPSYEGYYDEVRKAAAAGYIAGYDGGTWFAPDNPITREEVATVLFRISPGESSTKTPKGLLDAADIGEWAIEAVNSAYTKGYLSGYPDGNFYPGRNLTRAESVKIINKVLGIDQASRALAELTLTDYNNVRAVVNATSRSSGTLYWIVVEDPHTVPTPLQVSQGKDSVGIAAPKKGNVKVKAYEQASIIVDGLTASKSYTMYAMVKASDGKLTNVQTLRFNTEDEADMGENWITSFNVGTITEITALLSVNSSEKGTLYWVLVENSSGRPSQTNIAAGNDRDGDKALKSGNTAIDRNKTLNIDLTELKVGTSYDVYGYVSKTADAFSKVSSRSFTTAGVSTPAVRSLSAVINNDNMLEITASVSAKGTFYWIAVQESGGAMAPTPERVKAGKDVKDQVVTLNGNYANAEDTIKVTTASPAAINTTYRVYACMEGLSGALSSVSYTGIVEKVTNAGGLTGLTISAEGGRVVSGFSFDANVRDYPSVVVSNGSSNIIVRPTASSATDIIVDGRVVASGANSQKIPLPETPGTRLPIVIETSESGKAKQPPYTITVTENAPVPSSVYVSGSPENPPLLDDNTYSTTVPDNYKTVNVSMSFGSEFTGALIQDGSVTTVRSGERKTINLNEGGAGTTTVITLRLVGPSNGGDTGECSLVIKKQ